VACQIWSRPVVKWSGRKARAQGSTSELILWCGEGRGSPKSGSPRWWGLTGGERWPEVRYKNRGASPGVVEHRGVMAELAEVTAGWFCGWRWLSLLRSSRRGKAGGAMAPQWSTRRLRTGEATQLENGAQGGSNGASTRRGGTTVELEEQSNEKKR
jgi:hypothetical protein